MAYTPKGLVTAQEKERGREYTPKQRKFLTLFTKKDFREAKECAIKAGYKSNYHHIIYSLKDDIKEIAEAMLIAHAPRAAMTLSTIATQDGVTPGSQSKIAAAREVLDRAGVVKEERVQHDHNVTGGIFLLPTKAVPTPEAEAVEVEYEEVEE